MAADDKHDLNTEQRKKKRFSKWFEMEQQMVFSLPIAK